MQYPVNVLLNKPGAVTTGYKVYLGNEPGTAAACLACAHELSDLQVRGQQTKAKKRVKTNPKKHLQQCEAWLTAYEADVPRSHPNYY